MSDVRNPKSDFERRAVLNPPIEPRVAGIHRSRSARRGGRLDPVMLDRHLAPWSLPL